MQIQIKYKHKHTPKKLDRLCINTLWGSGLEDLGSLWGLGREVGAGIYQHWGLDK